MRFENLRIPIHDRKGNIMIVKPLYVPQYKLPLKNEVANINSHDNMQRKGFLTYRRNCLLRTHQAHNINTFKKDKHKNKQYTNSAS